MTVKIPNANGIIGTTSDKGSWWQDRFLSFAHDWICFYAPNTSRMEQEGMRFTDFFDVSHIPNVEAMIVVNHSNFKVLLIISDGGCIRIPGSLPNILKG